MKEFSIIEKLDRWMKIYVKHCCEIIIYSIGLLFWLARKRRFVLLSPRLCPAP